MNRILAAALAAIFVFTATSCSNEPEEPKPDREEVFADSIRDKTDTWDSESDALIVYTAEEMCAALGRGASPLDLLYAMLSHGVSPRDAGHFVGAGTLEFCPEYKDRLENHGGGN